MSIINQAINAILILVEAGGIFRICKIIFDIIAEPDTAAQNTKKIKNVIIFMIFAALVYTFKNVVASYFGYIVV